MTKATKIILWVVVAIIVIGGIYAFTNQRSSSNEPIRIGFIGPLSGEGASFGETEKNMMTLAVQDINAAGGIHGRPLEIIFEDGKASGKDATTAMQKLVTIDKVKIVLGGVASAETLAAAPIAETSRVILFSGFSSNPAITTAGDYIFRNSPSDIDVAKLDADAIATRYKSAALLSEETDYSIGVRDVMKGIFTERNIAMTADEMYGGTTTDFRTLLSKIKSSEAEVLYINPGTSAKAGGIIVKQARELGMRIPIHGNFSLGTPEALETGGTFMNGVVISDSINATEQLKQILERYENTYGEGVVHDFLAGAAYDRVYIVRDALMAVGYDAEKIKNYLYEIQNYDGMLGSYHFDENGDVVGKFFANVVLQDGEKIPLEQAVPAS